VAIYSYSGLSVREEADRSGSYSVKHRLEGVDGRRVDDLLWETIPPVSYTNTRSEKKWRLRSSRHLFFIILAVCPLVTVLLLNEKMLVKLVDHPLYILNTSSRSAQFLLSSNDHKLRNSSRLAYDN